MWLAFVWPRPVALVEWSYPNPKDCECFFAVFAIKLYTHGVQSIQAEFH